jgi:predicted RNase H-like HicB family nuclease
MATYTVNVAWDDEAAVWYAQSAELPGLQLCAPSLDSLLREAEDAALELLTLRGELPSSARPDGVRLIFKAERSQQVA